MRIEIELATYQYGARGEKVKVRRYRKVKCNCIEYAKLTVTVMRENASN